MALYAAAILLGAFLLFLVQPIMARVLLPSYGGSASVWTTCMLFFQLGLLGGHAYAHGLARRFRPGSQTLVHSALVLLSLAFLPVVPSASWRPEDVGDATAEILLLLALTIGLPYLLVSTTAPLLQHWLSRTHPARSPYRLYAVSNLGALLGLVSYPFWIEPSLALGDQSKSWSWGYAVYALAVLALALRLARRGGHEAAEPSPEDRPSTPGLTQWRWGLLAATGSMVFLAATNQLCLNVAVVPFLFLLPLSLYLLSYIVCFERESLYVRPFWTAAFLVAVGALLLMLREGNDVRLPIQILVYAGVVFSACMICHGELVRARPPARELTRFYLIVAAGGAAGGATVALVAPRVFDEYWEFPLALLLTYALLGLSLLRSSSAESRRAAGAFGAPLWIAGGAAFAYFLGAPLYDSQRVPLAIERNFHGVLRVYEDGANSESWRRYLWHGPICHGAQFLHPERRREPAMYYTAGSGIAVAIENYPRRSHRRIGVIGLGTGTLAAYGKPGDVVRFYEVNPEVVRLAREYFTYLEDSPARVEIVVGDGRLSLEKELAEHGSQELDILAVDAFSGDAIPVHLLTREAFRLYRQHLRPGGILAVHVSNLYFNLRPVVRGLAESLGMPAIHIEHLGNPAEEVFSTNWVLLTENGEFLANETVARAITPWRADQGTLIWTDDYSNLFRVLAD